MPRLVLAAMLLVLAFSLPVRAQDARSDLNQLSIEELMSIEITSASRKEQRAEDIAAAVFVITHRDIRRSGMTTIPDLLRLVPGVNVAQFNSSNWAVSVRGFNGLYANKLLVVVDGRSVYNWIFSGVNWDAEDLMVDDIERIEVIRGPGAAIWGANAVNGVINIVTKTAAETQGGLVSAEVGRWGQQGAVRFGGAIGSARYRLYAQWTGRESSLISPGRSADDDNRNITAGFRADWAAANGLFMLEGSATAGESHPLWTNLDGPTAAEEPIIEARSEAEAGHLLARWTHRRAGGASLQVQAFVDLAARREPIADYHRRTIDVETQYHVPLGGRHDLVAGIGYRLNADNYGGRGGFSLHPNAAQAFRFTTFVQDEIALLQDRLALTLGTHIQYESDARAGLQPNARLIWKVRPRQRLWTSASRALRSASRYERGIRVDFPPVLTPAGLPLTVNVLGNPDVQAETFMDLEAGYRLEVAQTAGMSITAFRGSYRNLQTQETSPPIIQFVPGPELHVTTTFGNLLTASTRGIEAAAYWSPASAWRLDASYAALRVTPQLSALSTDPTAGIDEGRAPRSQWQMRSTFSPGARTSVGASLFHVSALRWAQVPAYTRADVSAEWRLSPRLSAMVIGQNLLDRAHPEFTSVGSLLLATQVPRSVSIRLRWVSR